MKGESRADQSIAMAFSLHVGVFLFVLGFGALVFVLGFGFFGVSFSGGGS